LNQRPGPERFCTMNALSLKSLVSKISLQKTKIYAMIAAGTFPAPIKLGGSRSAWIESEVEDWLTSCTVGVQAPKTGAKRGRKPKVRLSEGVASGSLVNA